MNTPVADYISAFTARREPALERSALLLVDLQYATGSRQGALGRVGEPHHQARPPVVRLH